MGSLLIKCKMKVLPLRSYQNVLEDICVSDSPVVKSGFSHKCLLRIFSCLLNISVSCSLGPHIPHLQHVMSFLITAPSFLLRFTNSCVWLWELSNSLQIWLFSHMLERLCCLKVFKSLLLKALKEGYVHRSFV